MSGVRRSGRVHPDAETLDGLTGALVQNFIFKAIEAPVLAAVAHQMFRCEFAAGTTIIQQGAPPQKDDCLFYVQVGQGVDWMGSPVGTDLGLYCGCGCAATAAAPLTHLPVCGVWRGRVS